MPRGPKGERRPADVIVNAVKVMRSADSKDDTPRLRRRPLKIGGKSTHNSGLSSGIGSDDAALAGGLSQALMTWEDVIALVDAEAPKPSSEPTLDGWTMGVGLR